MGAVRPIPSHRGSAAAHLPLPGPRARPASNPASNAFSTSPHHLAEAGRRSTRG